MWCTTHQSTYRVGERIKDVIEQGNPWEAGKLLTEANKLLGTAKAVRNPFIFVNNHVLILFLSSVHLRWQTRALG
jgi:hypothetical protein